MLFYMNLYRKCDFLCEGSVEFYYDRRRQEMLGIQEIVSIEEYKCTFRIFFLGGGGKPRPLGVA